MIWDIVRKEIQDNLLGFKFYVTFVLTIALFLITGFLFLGSYQQRLSDYSRDRNESLKEYQESVNNLSSVALNLHEIYIKPKSLGFVSAGKEGNLPNLFLIRTVGRERLPINKGRFNIFLPDFSHLNWIYLIGVLLSFVALIISYDGLTREKERGTLGLVIANPVTRHSILLGKYLGTLLTILVPLIAGIIVNLVVVISSPLIFLGGFDWGRIASMFGISLVYLSLFVLIGLFISSRTRSSAVSLVLSLLVWVFFALVIPSSGPILSRQLQRISKRNEIEKKASAASSNVWDSYPDEAHNWEGSPSATPGVELRVKMANEMDEAYNKAMEDYQRELFRQVNLAKNIARVSPFELYEYSAWTIIDVGFPRFLKIIEQMKRYQNDFTKFVKAKDAEDDESPHLLNSWHSDCISQKPVDSELIPMFEEKPASLSDGIRAALWDILILVLLNIVFFAGAYVSFLRHDVR